MGNVSDWSSKTILVVEDDKFTSIIIQNYLKKKNAVIFTANNGEQAVELARQYKPDFILMDLKLPGISGLEAIRRIKEFLPSTIIIAQTAFVSDSDRNDALSSGCSEYITKPLSSEKIYTAIEKFM